jgi:hypothetical protein
LFTHGYQHNNTVVTEVISSLALASVLSSLVVAS